MVVDDSKENLELVETFLKEEGYKNIIKASSGSDAFLKIDKNKPDLILLDVIMPGIDGFEICRILHNEEETSDIPKIMLTAKNSSEDLKRGFELGAVDYIKKPFDEVELVSRVQSALLLKQSRDEVKKKNISLLSLTQKNQETIETLNQKIIEHNKAEDALRESEEKFRTLSEQSYLGLIILQDGLVKYVNKALSDMLKYPIYEIMNWKPNEFAKAVHPDDHFFALEQARRKQDGNPDVVTRYQYRLVTKTGETRWVDQYSKTIQYMGKTADFATIIDITEQKQAEESIKQKNKDLQKMGGGLRKLNSDLEQKIKERTEEVEKLLKSKEEFVSQLGHDIKTPLTPILSLLPIIREGEANPKSKELLEICIQNANYIKNLVVNTLQLARLNSPDIVFDIKEVRLLDVVNSVLFDNQTLFENSNIEIENKIRNPIIVLADEFRLREVFINLITNAIKFTENGGKLTLDIKEDEDGFVTISVKDTGVGLDEEEKTCLFKEFYKSDSSSHEFNSTGLGLVICKRIVEKHGGKIWAESPGKKKGTTFYFTIPIKQKIADLSISAG